MTINGEIKEVIPGQGFHIYVPFENTHVINKQKSKMAEVRICDGRSISPEQRKKAKALINDISTWCGHERDWLQDYFKFNFCMDEGVEMFSLANCEMSIARDFISYLVDFVISHHVPLGVPTGDFVEDWARYIYKCLETRTCAVTGLSGADIHHCTGSRVGIGRDRKKIIHVGLVCIPLAREYHNECHNDEVKFMNRYKLFGIPLDKHLCNTLGMNFEAS